MSQNHDFKSNFADNQDANSDSYNFASDVRNVCFAWLDGRKMLFNYAYLVSVELNVKKPENCVTVCFTTHTIILHGYNLALLFDLFMNHIPKVIVETHSRYAVANSTEPIVIKIIFKE